MTRGHEDRRARGPKELAPGFWRLKAEWPMPERPTTVAVTRHLELIVPAGNFPVSGFPLSRDNIFGSQVSADQVSGTGLLVRERVRARTCTWSRTAEPVT